MIKLEHMTAFGEPATIGNGTELFSRPRYKVDFKRDKRDKIVDVEYLEDWQAPTHSFHVIATDGIDSVELAIRYDDSLALSATLTAIDNFDAIRSFPAGPVAVKTERRRIFRQYV